MSKIALAVVVGITLLWCAVGHAEEVIDPERLADAIYKAEGGKLAKVPYGILSVKVKDEAEARRVCLNTIRNNMARWQWARQNGDQRDYIQFLGDRYCPTTGATNDPSGLNKNWVKNVKSLYGVS